MHRKNIFLTIFKTNVKFKVAEIKIVKKVNSKLHPRTQGYKQPPLQLLIQGNVKFKII